MGELSQTHFYTDSSHLIREVFFCKECRRGDRPGISDITLSALYPPVQIIKRGGLHCLTRCNAQSEQRWTWKLLKALRSPGWLIWAGDPPPRRKQSDPWGRSPTHYEPRVEWSFLAFPIQWGRSSFYWKAHKCDFSIPFASPCSWWGKK